MPLAARAMSDEAGDAAFMQRALELAERGLYSTQPNPHVGAVLVRQGAIIAEGFHARAGDAHAEVAALEDARVRGIDVQGATLYVNLEPCNRVGRTPACVDAIIAAGLGRVVYAMDDPNPAMRGGAARLMAAGIAVDSGVGAEAARELNVGFVSLMTRGRPWVRVKIAATLDGRTALTNGRSQWITGTAARADGHRWRARAGAILTGMGTVAKDDPQLTVRDIETPRQPLRVIVDRHGETPDGARVLQGGNTLVVTAEVATPRTWPAGVEVVALPDAAGRVDLPLLLAELARRGINEVHVEAGARLNGAFMQADLVDEWLVYVAPALIGDVARGIAERRSPLTELADRTQLTFTDVAQLGPDLRVRALRVRH
jgi:diaminohydroxyphosphoribosylaminopyrimidine deaminase/5-amino-6-(5-phosphoribosylamino)uracil reductase